MNYTSLAAHFHKWQEETIRTIDDASLTERSQEAGQWGAGLVVSAVAFSRQLGTMQISLQQANKHGAKAEAFNQQS